MQSIGQYIFSVIGAALFISICKSILPKNNVVGSVSKLICGVLLTTVIVAPLKDIHFYDLSTFYSSIQTDAADLVNEGTETARVNLSEGIKERTTTYICDKASAIGLSLEIDVFLNNEDIPKPKEIHIAGDVSPFAKKQLMEIIHNDLDIAEENIKWS